jgi:hypothetical protein
MPDNIRLGELSGSDATDRLRAVIEENQRVTRRQTTVIIWLTWVMAILAFFTAVPVIADIWRASVPIIAESWSVIRSWGV